MSELMTVSKVHPVLQGVQPDPNELYGNFKPVRYRYVMAYLHDTPNPSDPTHPHKAGEVMYVLPLTGVSYSLGLYSGTEMSGNIYMPDFYLDLMAHPPSNVFQRVPHPDRSGIPIGSMFECGNRAIYILRNEKVVWGGILWSRGYSSGDSTMSITALSWEGYLYYRALRKSVVFTAKTNAYKIWWAVIDQTMNDFKFSDAAHGNVANEANRYLDGSAKRKLPVPWTGITRSYPRKKVGTKWIAAWSTSNAAPRSTDGTAASAYEVWPKNSPKIEMPQSSPTFKWKRNGVEVLTTVNETFRGYDMNRVGDALQTWADTETVATSTAVGAFRRFEYRVMSWFDDAQQIFRQRWLFGEMSMGTDGVTPTGITSEFIGKHPVTSVDNPDGLTFDYPGHISAWSLNESMEDCATRIIVVDQGEGALKHVEYVPNTSLMLVPGNTAAAATRGTQGWRLYDRVQSYETSSLSTLRSRGNRLLQLAHPPIAGQLSDLGTQQVGLHTSKRATDLSITLRTDPGTPFPEFGLGDWATFAIEDPFYGGKMYLQRRIIGYTVTIQGEQESDYSSEEITLELTDDTHISEGE
jgi:hypothetical protein